MNRARMLLRGRAKNRVVSRSESTRTWLSQLGTPRRLMAVATAAVLVVTSCGEAGPKGKTSDEKGSDTPALAAGEDSSTSEGAIDESTTAAPTTSVVTTEAPTTAAPTTTSAAPTTVPATTAAPTSAAALKYTFPVGSSSASFEHAHHDYPAADIFADCGSPVLAVTSGVVQDVSAVDVWDSSTDNAEVRGGLSVSVVGDDGVRYYGSHLESLDPATVSGARVASGQQLGTVGDTGNAAGTGCHLHFGISPPCGPGDWEVRRGVLEPWDLLEDWRDGGQLSPAAAIAAIGCG